MAEVWAQSQERWMDRQRFNRALMTSKACKMPGDASNSALARPRQIGWRPIVDTVDRGPARPHPAGELQRQAARQLAPHRIADDAFDEPARRAVGGDDREPLDAAEVAGLERAGLDGEG